MVEIKPASHTEHWPLYTGIIIITIVDFVSAYINYQTSFLVGREWMGNWTALSSGIPSLTSPYLWTTKNSPSYGADTTPRERDTSPVRSWCNTWVCLSVVDPPLALLLAPHCQVSIVYAVSTPSLQNNAIENILSIICLTVHGPSFCLVLNYLKQALRAIYRFSHISCVVKGFHSLDCTSVNEDLIENYDEGVMDLIKSISNKLKNKRDLLLDTLRYQDHSNSGKVIVTLQVKTVQ